MRCLNISLTVTGLSLNVVYVLLLFWYGGAQIQSFSSIDFNFNCLAIPEKNEQNLKFLIVNHLLSKSKFIDNSDDSESNEKEIISES